MHSLIDEGVVGVKAFTWSALRRKRSVVYVCLFGALVSIHTGYVPAECIGIANGFPEFF